MDILFNIWHYIAATWKLRIFDLWPWPDLDSDL